jgi:hypothetical protein
MAPTINAKMIMTGALNTPKRFDIAILGNCAIYAPSNWLATALIAGN